MKQKRRESIRRKVQRMLLVVSMLAMGAVGLIAVTGMLYLRWRAERALARQTTQYLHSMAQDKAALLEAHLSTFAATASLLADCVHERSLAPVAPQQARPQTAAQSVWRRVLAHTDLAPAVRVRDEQLLSALEPRAAAVLRENDAVSALYAATKNGVLVSYRTTRDDEADSALRSFLSQDWFTQGMEHSGAYFTEMHTDGARFVVCAAPFDDAAGNFAGVVALKLHIGALYDADNARHRVAHVFLIDGQGRIISPANGDAFAPTTQESDVPTKDSSARASCVVPSLGWKLCVALPQSVAVVPRRILGRPASVLLTSLMLILTAELISILLIARRFSRRFTRPLIQLQRDIKKISGGNFNYHACNNYADDEIGDLAMSFTQMAFALRRYVEYVTRITAESERLHAELDVATRIQSYLLPSRFPAFPDHTEFDLYASMTNATEVGGDFYDFFLVDSDHLVVVMGDVSGKGFPAALFMVNTKTLIKNQALMGGSPAQILAQVNEQLCEQNEGAMFVTVWLGMLELSTGLFTATNAGHTCPAVLRAGGRYELVQNEHCPPLATIEALLFDEVTVTFNAGDCLCLYTDGVAEAKNAAGESFGTERLLAALNAVRAESPQTQLHAVQNAIDTFVGEMPQYDDITLLSLHYRGIAQ